MTKIITKLHCVAAAFDRKAQHFAFRHPFLAFLAMFVGMPMFILFAVSLSTVVIMFPVAWLFGWL